MPEIFIETHKSLPVSVLHENLFSGSQGRHMNRHGKNNGPTLSLAPFHETKEYIPEITMLSVCVPFLLLNQVTNFHKTHNTCHAIGSTPLPSSLISYHY
jgi:hypothetical protein